MITRTIALAVSLALIGTTPAGADSQKEKLRKLLEKKYSTKKSKPQKGDDLYVVDPSGKVRRAPTPKKSGNRSMLPAVARNAVASTAGQLPTGGAALSKHRGARPELSDGAGRAPDETVRVAAKAAEMLINRSIIVIQLKPGASNKDIDSLIAKYKLNVVDVVPSLGALYVELNTNSGRSRSAPPKKADSVRTLLEPPIVQQLRKEPSVNSCFVQSTVTPQWLPQRSQARIQRGKTSVKWHWDIGKTDDGNWGLKAMRMPPVWSVLSRVRKARGEVQTAPVAILDSGFGRHRQLRFAHLASPLPASAGPANCATGHGTHVAGIIGADPGLAPGIDGIVPQARLDLIPISKNLMLEGAMQGRQRSQLHLSYFADVIRDLAEYFDAVPRTDAERRVVNVSLAYNWGWVAKTGTSDPTTDQSIRNQIGQHANFVQYLVNREKEQVLFVAAAGNDSANAAQPLNAELATPFGYAARHKSSFFTPSENIIIVEAHDRWNRRADFSNVGGHVAAPGVDVMSTLASDKEPYALCSGTSQAAPHVAALAAIMFELKPTASPVEIAKLITSSATSDTESAAAPRVDALAAIVRMSGSHLQLLADLNGDGSVDASDLNRFKRDLTALENGRFGGPIANDLNGDGTVDDTERCWPLIDLNGSGRASFDAADKRRIGGVMHSDLDVIEAAWTNTAQTFQDAMATNGLAELINVWRTTSLVAAAPADAKSLPCQ